MNDYDALRDYLKTQKLPEFVLSFEQIEEIIDAVTAARVASRVVVGDAAQSAGEDAAARGLPRRRLHRDQARRRQERAVQADEVTEGHARA